MITGLNFFWPARRELPSVRCLLDNLQQFRCQVPRRPQSRRDYLSYGEAERNKRLDTADLAAYTTVASLIFNLDEAVTKE